jgi:acetyl esterase
MTVIRRAEFESEAHAFLELVGPQDDGPVSHEDLVRSRQQVPDPALAGVPESVAICADVLVPLADRALRVRVYRDEVHTPQPVLLWLHGGGFVGGSLDDVHVACSAVARRAGVIVVSLDYRLAPEHPYPAALHDTLELIAWLSEHGALIGGDGRIAAGGQSSGANLVAAATLVARDRGGPTVARQILCYPALDFGYDSESHRRYNGVLLSAGQMRWYDEQYLNGAEITSYVSPLSAPELTALPPALILGAGYDPMRDDARRYARRLDESGCEVRYLEYAQTPHAFLNFPGVLSAAWHAIDDVAADIADFFAIESR